MPIALSIREPVWERGSGLVKLEDASDTRGESSLDSEKLQRSDGGNSERTERVGAAFHLEREHPRNIA